MDVDTLDLEVLLLTNYFSVPLLCLIIQQAVFHFIPNTINFASKYPYA